MYFREREDREFEEAMRDQVGTIFPSTNGLDNHGIILKCLLIPVLMPIVKKTEISGHAYLLNYAIDFHGRLTYCYILYLFRGWIQASVLQRQL